MTGAVRASVWSAEDTLRGASLGAADLPKTRSGKIMRRLLRDIAAGKVLGDVTTLAEPAVIDRLKKQYMDTGA